MKVLAIETLITERCKALGLSRPDLVRLAGFKNVAKGLRRLDALCAGEMKATGSLMAGLPAALELPPDANGGNGGRKRLLPIIEPFSDDKIMFDMKELLLKVNETNKATIIDQITKLHFTPSCEDKLADMILDVTINCIFLVNIYVDIILSMESKHKNIINRINKAIIYQIYCQRKFPSENDANACETSEQKAKKWHINNAILIAELFLRNKYRPDMIINKVLTPLIDQITPDNTVNIELLTKIFPIIGPKIEIILRYVLGWHFQQNGTNIQ